MRIWRWTVEGISLNDDFANKVSDVWATLKKRRPAWVGVQEGKRRDYADDLGPRYDVTQRMTSKATQGVAVIVDLHQLHTVGGAVDRPDLLGRGYRQFTEAGGGILARGVAWRDVEQGSRGSGRLVRLGSTHRHPKRERDQWDEFDEALAEWIEASPIPVWLVADVNQGEPVGLARRLAARVRGFHVDHHFLTGGLTFRSRPIVLRGRSSDHRAVAQRVRIPKQPKHKETR